MKSLASLLTVVVIAVITLSGPMSASAAEIEEIHFLIPGGAGGGWDGTARGDGEALTKSGWLDSAEFTACLRGLLCRNIYRAASGTLPDLRHRPDDSHYLWFRSGFRTDSHGRSVLWRGVRRLHVVNPD